jgi:hypothetical protein
MKLHLFLLVFCCLFSLQSNAQLKTKTYYKSKNQIDLKPREIKKLTFVQLEGNGKRFPDSYLLGMRDDNLILATDISRGFTEKANFVKSEVDLNKYDYLTIVNRKMKYKKMALWGAIVGAIGYYFAQKHAKPTDWEVRNKTLLGQSPNNGIAEGIIGGITGIGLGIIIGSELAKKRINLKGQRRTVARKLKKFNFYQ